MPILFLSEKVRIRSELKNFLKNVAKKKNLKILDIGASANPWLEELITDALDIYLTDRKNIKSHVGDANLLSSYEKFKDDEFDFINCTHTLEDIRSPDIAISQMMRIGKAGFIAVPNRHTEVSNLRKFAPFGSKYTFGGRNVGFFHHRWIFNNTSKNTIEAYAKWSGISSTESLYEKIIKKIANLPILKKKYLNIITKLGVRDDGNYKWVKPELVDYRNSELSFIWVKDFNFNYFNNDYAGHGDPNTIRLFNNFVSTEPADTDKNLESTFQTIERIFLNNN